MPLRFENDIAVIKIEQFGDLEELMAIVSRLIRMTAASELKGIVLDLQGKIDPHDNLSRASIFLHKFRRASRRYDRPDAGYRFPIVLCNPNPRRDGRRVGSDYVWNCLIVDSVETGIESLANRHDQSTMEACGSPTVPIVASRRVFLVGCIEKDLGEIPDRLKRAGFEVADSATATVNDGDHVIFCVSYAYGPTEGTKRSVNSCEGKEIFPLCIVRNDTDLVDDDSLLGLVSVDSDFLLAQILPENVIESLPSFYDFDLNLPEKITRIMNQKLDSVRCK